MSPIPRQLSKATVQPPQLRLARLEGEEAERGDEKWPAGVQFHHPDRAM
jgi:hypothetical protein